jgi:hypothetical protein
LRFKPQTRRLEMDQEGIQRLLGSGPVVTPGKKFCQSQSKTNRS